MWVKLNGRAPAFQAGFCGFESRHPLILWVKAVIAKLASQDVPNVQALGSNPGDRNENEANECQINISSVHLLSKKLG